MQTKIYLAILLAWLCLCYAQPPSTVEARPLGTDVSRTIDVDTTWTAAGSPYVLTGDVTVLSGVTLAIEAGTEVLFPYYGWDLIVNGTLNIDGTQETPVTLRGTRDNSTIARGGTILLSSDSTNSILNHVVVESMGGVGYSGNAIQIETSSVIINNSIITGSHSVGIYIASNSQPTISNTRFEENDTDIKASVNSVSGIGENNNLKSTLIYGGQIDKSTFWPEDGSPYTLSADVLVSKGVTLAIEAGTEVLFPYYGWDLIVNGTLNIDGTQGMPVTLRGTRDNTTTHGGTILLSSDSTNSILNHVVVESMGGVGYSGNAIQIETSSAVINNSIITGSHSVGIYIASNSQPTISNTRLEKNDTDIKAAVNSVSSIGENNDLKSTLIYGGQIDKSTFWPEDGSPYTLSADVLVSKGVTLTIEAGTEVLFPYYRDFRIGCKRWVCIVFMLLHFWN